MAVYHRIMLKLSGEALRSDRDLFDFEKMNRIADVIRRRRNGKGGENVRLQDDGMNLLQTG